MFDNKYDIDFFRDRMMASLDDYQIVLNNLSSFDKVIIADLGDALDGWDASTTRKNSNHTLITTECQQWSKL